MSKQHLFIVIHGLLGNVSHVEYISETIQKEIPDSKTFLPTCNTGFHTFDGIEICSSRILIELQEFLEEEKDNGTEYTKLSIVGYSMGGLKGRHLIGLMSEKGILDNFELVSFTTFATPHVGSYFNKNVSYSSALNYLGSHLLGRAGNDLFMSKSSILDELADPDQSYFKALSRFKYLISFTNTVNDRTVPFWTGYISNKNPFEYRDHLDIKHFKYQPEGTAEKENLARKFPCTFLDLANSKFLKVSPTGVEYTPTGRERLFRVTVLVFLLFFPMLIIVTSLMSVISAWRVTSFLRSNKNAVSDSAHSNTSGHRRRGSSLSQGVATTAMDAIGDMLVRAPTSGPIDEESELNGPVPLLGQGYDGLIDSTPKEVELEPRFNRIITNLNRLHWEKYAVRVERLHSHAEIVNRRNTPGQGCLIVGYWGEMLANKLKKTSPS